jgi:hypothetical protein
MQYSSWKAQERKLNTLRYKTQSITAIVPLVFLSLVRSGANIPLEENGSSSVKKQSLYSGIMNQNLWLHYNEKIKQFGREPATKKSIYKPFVLWIWSHL